MQGDPCAVPSESSARSWSWFSSPLAAVWGSGGPLPIGDVVAGETFEDLASLVPYYLSPTLAARGVADAVAGDIGLVGEKVPAAAALGAFTV
jgi:hypothetical protein